MTSVLAFVLGVVTGTPLGLLVMALLVGAHDCAEMNSKR